MGDRATGCPDRIFVWFFEIINNLFFLQKETKKSSKKYPFDYHGTNDDRPDYQSDSLLARGYNTINPVSTA